MREEWVCDPHQFAALEPAWEQLAEREGSPFARHAWFSSWWKAFGAGRTLEICTIWDGFELAAAFPLCRGRAGLEPLANEHTPSFEPLARDDEALEALVSAVLVATPALVISRVPAGSPLLGLLARESRAAGRLVLTQETVAAPFVDTRGDLDAYWAQLSGNARRDFRRCRRLLAAVPGVGQAVLERPVDLEAELAEGFAVEGSGWKSRQGTAIVDSPATVTFYTELARAFARLDKLRLSTLSIDGHTAAFNLDLVDHGRAWGLKGGYDPAYSRYAPGLLLILAEVERCFELGLSSLELLGEEAAWKRKLTRDTRPHHTVGFFMRRPLPLVRYGFERHLRPSLKRGYRRLLPGRARG